MALNGTAPAGLIGRAVPLAQGIGRSLARDEGVDLERR